MVMACGEGCKQEIGDHSCKKCQEEKKVLKQRITRQKQQIRLLQSGPVDRICKGDFRKGTACGNCVECRSIINGLFIENQSLNKLRNAYRARVSDLEKRIPGLHGVCSGSYKRKTACLNCAKCREEISKIAWDNEQNAAKVHAMQNRLNIYMGQIEKMHIEKDNLVEQLETQTKTKDHEFIENING